MIKFSEIRPLKKAQVIATVICIGAPICYLLAATYMSLQTNDNPANELMFKVLLALSVVQPLFGFLIDKFHVVMYRKNLTNKQTPEKLFIVVTLTKVSLVNAVFLYGLVVVIMTGYFNYFSYFYLLGAIWAYIFFPTERSYKKFMEKINRT